MAWVAVTRAVPRRGSRTWCVCVCVCVCACVCVRAHTHTHTHNTHTRTHTTHKHTQHTHTHTYIHKLMSGVGGSDAGSPTSRFKDMVRKEAEEQCVPAALSISLSFLPVLSLSLFLFLSLPLYLSLSLSLSLSLCISLFRSLPLSRFPRARSLASKMVAKNAHEECALPFQPNPFFPGTHLSFSGTKFMQDCIEIDSRYKIRTCLPKRALDTILHNLH